MKIDITKLNEKELVELNRRIIERLNFLEFKRAHDRMMNFNVGEKVCFDPPDREKQVGVLIKYNRKTVTVVTEGGERWNVSPHFLSKVQSDVAESSKRGKVIQIRERT